MTAFSGPGVPGTIGDFMDMFTSQIPADKLDALISYDDALDIGLRLVGDLFMAQLSYKRDNA